MRKWRIIALMVAVCFASCQPQQSIDKALAEADSLFAIGQSSLGNHPYMRSILYYQRALDVLQGDDTVSLSRKTRIFAEMGKLYAQRQLYTEAINRFQLSLTCAEQTHDSLGQMLAYKGLGESYLRLTNTHEAIRYYNLADQLAIQLKDEQMQTSIAFHTAAAYIEAGKKDKAINQLPPVPYHINEGDSDVYYFVKAHLFETQHLADSADYYYTRLFDSGIPFYQQYSINQKLQHAIQQKDYYTLTSLLRLKREFELNNETNAQYEATGTIGTMYQVLHTERENANLQIKNQQIQYYSIIGILILLAIITITVLLLYRIRNEKMRMQRNQALLEKYNEALKNDLEVERAKTSTPQPNADIKTIAIREAEIYQRLLATEKPINETNAMAMMELVNSLYPDFKTRLTTFGVIKEHEVKMCYLIKMGFKTSRIATLLSRTDSAISNGRMRMYKKVFGKEGKGEDWDKVIMSL